ncbi:MAG TPA: hypothetical protein VE343_07030 [Streptosporangiaceae bacterium]|nr:hypothetical protein [Streptosporangiaceae bacterium]
MVTSVSLPLRTCASIRSSGWVSTASRKSSVTPPLPTRTSIRRGTTQPVAGDGRLNSRAQRA